MLQNHSLCCTTSAAPAQRPAKKQARAFARACFDRVSLIPVPVPCAPVCNPVYKIVFPVPFPAYSFLSPRKVGAFAGPSRLCSCVAGRKAHKNRRCFVLSLGGHLVYRFFFRDGRRRPPLPPPFGADPKAAFLQKVRSAPSFRPASACRKPCRLWTARRNCAHPPPCIQQGRFAG